MSWETRNLVIDKDKDVLVKKDRSTKCILKTLLTQHINEQQANITSKHMHQHVCIIILLSLMINFNLIKKYYFPYIFMSTEIQNWINFHLFWKEQILGCYNSSPLRWISSSRFGRQWSKRYGYSAFGCCSLPWVVPSSCRDFGFTLHPLVIYLQVIALFWSHNLVQYQTNDDVNNLEST